MHSLIIFLPLNMETLYGAKGGCYFWHADKHKHIGSIATPGITTLQEE